jgi:hypothetical protein
MTPERGQEMLRQIAEYYGISKNSDFAKFFGLSIQTSFQRMKNGTLDYEQIYSRCPDISPDWLLSGGEGEMLRKKRGDNSESRSETAKCGSDKHSPANDKSLEMTLAALAREQEALAHAQKQVSDLINLLASKNQ